MCKFYTIFLQSPKKYFSIFCIVFWFLTLFVEKIFGHRKKSSICVNLLIFTKIYLNLRNLPS